MKKLLLLLPVLLLCVSCVSHTMVKGPDGQILQIVECTDIEKCYDKANEVCPSGFVIFHQEALPYFTEYGGGVNREITFECK